ncbi:type IV secretion protein Rhs, partial [Pseudomonas sp. SDO5532_S415]
MDHIARIEQELEHFPNTLALYRQQLSRWLSQSADRLSHVADMPSLFGMERVIKFGNSTTVVSSGDDDFISTVTQCSKGGPLQIESKFESVSDVPLGKIQVDVIALSSGKSTPITLDENGKGQFSCLSGESYRLRVQNEVTPEQLDELFRSYDGLTQALETWLRSEWSAFKPQWSQSTLLTVGNGMLAGSWAAIEGVWDGIQLLSDILQDPGQFADRLGHGVEQLKKLAQDTPQAMANLQLLASDEAVLCLLLRAASLWLEMLPPSVIAGEIAKAVSTRMVELLIDILIAIVLTCATAGGGIAYLKMRLARRGAQLINAVMRLVEALFSILNTFMGFVEHYKKIAARGVTAGLKKGRMQLRWKARNNTRVKKDEAHDDASKQAKNPNGDSADTAAHT